MRGDGRLRVSYIDGKIAGLPGKVARFLVGAPKADVRDINHRVLKFKLIMDQIESLN